MSETLQVKLISELHANSDMYTVVDVVLVHGDEMGLTLAEISAEDWFSMKEDVVDTGDGAILVQSYEISPGGRLDHELLYGLSADRVFVFCRYATRGKHQAELPISRCLTIHLRETDFLAYADSSSLVERKRDQRWSASYRDSVATNQVDGR